jgi:putative phosphoribosyl transferase
MDVLEHTRGESSGESAQFEAAVRGLDTARALVVFLRSRAEGRLTSLEEYIAAGLEVRGFATVHVNLLSKQEQEADDRTGCHHLDREFHRTRAAAVLEWVGADTALRELPLGIFADGAAAAAALEAAAAFPDQVRAIVCLDGRVDLAEPDYGGIRADTLLLVAEGNTHIADLNRTAQLHIAGARLELVPHATHHYDDTSAITHVAWRTVEWFSTLCA